MSMPVPVYVINLDRSKDRLAHIREQASHFGFAIIRIPAVLGMRIPTDLQHYFLHIQKRRRPIIERGAIGCYASHLKTWKDFVDSGAKAALVLEDDALLPEDLPQTIVQALAALPVGWDYVHLSRPPRRAYKEMTKLACGRSIIRYSKIPAGTLGYLISQSGAKKLLNEDIARFWSVDIDTRRPWLFGLDVYGMVPEPIDTGPFATTIRLGHKRSPRRGLPRPTRLSWTNMPLETPRALLYYIRTLGPTWWLRCATQNFASKLGLGERSKVQLAKEPSLAPR